MKTLFHAEHEPTPNRRSASRRVAMDSHEYPTFKGQSVEFFYQGGATNKWARGTIDIAVDGKDAGSVDFVDDWSDEEQDEVVSLFINLEFANRPELYKFVVDWMREEFSGRKIVVEDYDDDPLFRNLGAKGSARSASRRTAAGGEWQPFPKVTNQQAQRFVNAARKIGYGISVDEAYDILMLSGGYAVAVSRASILEDVYGDVNAAGGIDVDSGFGISVLIESTDYLGWVYNNRGFTPTKADCEKMIGLLRTKNQRDSMRWFIDREFGTTASRRTAAAPSDFLVVVKGLANYMYGNDVTITTNVSFESDTIDSVKKINNAAVVVSNSELSRGESMAIVPVSNDEVRVYLGYYKDSWSRVVRSGSDWVWKRMEGPTTVVSNGQPHPAYVPGVGYTASRRIAAKSIVTECSGCRLPITLDLGSEQATVRIPSNGIRGQRHVPAHDESSDLDMDDTGLLVWDCPSCGYADSYEDESSYTASRRTAAQVSFDWPLLRDSWTQIAEACLAVQNSEYSQQSASVAQSWGNTLFGLIAKFDAAWKNGLRSAVTDRANAMDAGLRRVQGDADMPYSVAAARHLVGEMLIDRPDWY